MPSTTSLPPQLQRRTCSRNRFSSFSYRPLPSRFRSRPLSFFEPGVFSARLFRSSIALSSDHRLSLTPTFFQLSFPSPRSFSHLISLSLSTCLLYILNVSLASLLFSFFLAPAIFLLEPCFLLHSLSFFLFLFLSLVPL